MDADLRALERRARATGVSHDARHGGALRLTADQRLWDFGAIGGGPPGYAILQIDSGHTLYVVLTEDGTDWTYESPIHWNRYVVRQWAWEAYRRKRAGEEGSVPA